MATNKKEPKPRYLFTFTGTKGIDKRSRVLLDEDSTITSSFIRSNSEHKYSGVAIATDVVEATEVMNKLIQSHSKRHPNS